MAVINSKLQRIASELFIKHQSEERENIDKKIDNLKINLKSYFTSRISEIIVFGSYKRDTILPRKFDKSSDIDILIIFNQFDNEYKPETYRNQLKRFAECKYQTTRVIKDYPSIVLEMSNIQFDLVPCRQFNNIWVNTYQIPSRSDTWMYTDPTGFNISLTNANVQYGSMLKPIIRLFKRWNAFNNYPYATFELEKLIANMDFRNQNFETGFLSVINQLTLTTLVQDQSNKLKTLKANGLLIAEFIKIDAQNKALELIYKVLGLECDLK